jgi:NAD-dependent deacetylase
MTDAATIDFVASLLHGAARALVFTGAGMSTGSGIPDFRGPGGVWTRRPPVYYQDFMRSPAARLAYWDYVLEGHDAFRGARPNAAHHALVALERRGRLATLVTQNIDGLHAAAGHDERLVIEVHGTRRFVQCQSCQERFDPEPVVERFRRTRQPPCCACGGLLKPATVSFGQAMPEDKMRAALDAAARADLVLAIGSTLSVHPAAQVPLAAAQAGAPYVIINRGGTAHDDLADVRIDDDAVVVLPRIVAALDAL